MRAVTVAGIGEYFSSSSRAAGGSGSLDRNGIIWTSVPQICSLRLGVVGVSSTTTSILERVGTADQRHILRLVEPDDADQPAVAQELGDVPEAAAGPAPSGSAADWRRCRPAPSCRPACGICSTMPGWFCSTMPSSSRLTPVTSRIDEIARVRSSFIPGGHRGLRPRHDLAGRHAALLRPHDRGRIGPALLGLVGIVERVELGDHAALRAGVEDVERLAQPFIGPALRVQHRLDEAVEGALVAVAVRGDEFPGEAAPCAARPRLSAACCRARRDDICAGAG